MKNNNLNNFVQLKNAFGLVLALIGVQFGTALRNIFPSINLVNVFMVLSVFLIIDYNKLFFCKLDYKKMFFASPFVIILLFFLIGSILSNDYEYIFYHFYLIALLFAVGTNSSLLENKYFIPTFSIVGSIIILVVFYQATYGFTDFSIQKSYTGTGKLWLSEGGDPITIPRSIVYSSFAIMSFTPRKKTNKITVMPSICKLLFMILALFDLFAFSNRSSIVFFMLGIGYFLMTNYLRIKQKKKSLLCFFLLAIVVLLSIFFINYKSTINSLFSSVSSAIKSLIGFNDSDASGLTRYNIRSNILLYTNNNLTIINLLFGFGYCFEYLDFPALQIFIDCGIIIGSIYVYVLMVKPFSFSLKSLSNKTITSEVKIMSMIFITTLFDQFYCGEPYYVFLWTPAIILTSSLYKKRLYKRVINDYESVTLLA